MAITLSRYTSTAKGEPTVYTAEVQRCGVIVLDNSDRPDWRLEIVLSDEDLAKLSRAAEERAKAAGV